MRLRATSCASSTAAWYALMHAASLPDASSLPDVSAGGADRCSTSDFIFAPHGRGAEHSSSGPSAKYDASWFPVVASFSLGWQCVVKC